MQYIAFERHWDMLDSKIQNAKWSVSLLYFHLFKILWTDEKLVLNWNSFPTQKRKYNTLGKMQWNSDILQKVKPMW